MEVFNGLSGSREERSLSLDHRLEVGDLSLKLLFEELWSLGLQHVLIPGVIFGNQLRQNFVELHESGFSLVDLHKSEVFGVLFEHFLLPTNDKKLIAEGLFEGRVSGPVDLIGQPLDSLGDAVEPHRLILIENSLFELPQLTVLLKLQISFDSGQIVYGVSIPDEEGLSGDESEKRDHVVVLQSSLHISELNCTRLDDVFLAAVVPDDSLDFLRQSLNQRHPLLVFGEFSLGLRNLFAQSIEFGFELLSIDSLGSIGLGESELGFKR